MAKTWNWRLFTIGTEWWVVKHDSEAGKLYCHACGTGSTLENSWTEEPWEFHRLSLMTWSTLD